MYAQPEIAYQAPQPITYAALAMMYAKPEIAYPAPQSITYAAPR